MEILRKYNVDILSTPISFEDDVNKEFNFIKEIIDLCDDVIISEGVHIHDIYYKIIKYLYKEDKPTLGLWLSMQIIGKVFNNKLGKRLNVITITK